MRATPNERQTMNDETVIMERSVAQKRRWSIDGNEASSMWRRAAIVVIIKPRYLVEEKASCGSAAAVVVGSFTAATAPLTV